MPDDTTATNKDLVARFLLLLVNDDAAGMRPLVADDVIWWVPASASTRFGLDRINRSPARFDVKKLTALHFEHTRRMDPDAYVAQGVQYLRRAGIETSDFDPSYVRAALLTSQEKGKLFSELPLWTDFFFVADDALVLDPEARAKTLVPTARPVIERLAASFGKVPEFSAASLETALKQLAIELGVKAGALVQPCRLACTGRLVGPSLYHLLEVLGPTRVAARLSRAAALAGG